MALRRCFYSVNDLWLEIVQFTNGLVTVAAHNTTNGAFYQLLSQPDLRDGSAILDTGEIVQGASGTNVTLFSPVPAVAQEPVFWANSTNRIIYLDTYDSPIPYTAVEPANSAGGAADQ